MPKQVTGSATMREADTVAYMNIKEFREQGYLQELNRLFLHPLGLALEVVQDDMGDYLGGIWDYRKDLEGMCFADGELEPLKAEYVAAELGRRQEARVALFGGVAQGVEVGVPDEPVGDDECPACVGEEA